MFKIKVTKKGVKQVFLKVAKTRVEKVNNLF